MTIKGIIPITLLLIVAILLTPAIFAQSSCPYTVTFNVTPTSGPAYITVSISGIPQGHEVYLHWGIEPYPQGPWSDVTDTLMSWNGENYTVTIGPFQPGTWVAWVFHDATTNTWINYQCVPFWNWNVDVNPPNAGYTWAYVYPNGSILITMLGRAPDNILLWYGLTSGPGNVPWYTTSGSPGAMNASMTFNPLWGNYSVMIGPFKPAGLLPRLERAWVVSSPCLHRPLRLGSWGCPGPAPRGFSLSWP
ncbi:hypothetical protein [Vulcanisaeta sp. EB80]|uniref:hypothetical protein n=1 Tax=Vulcanisaeta sp. EB80 TaxID=1650660 RepID=UPI001EE3F75C|nr:hypothetical protein [Vulcanisaeta sp. EB80]